MKESAPLLAKILRLYVDSNEKDLNQYSKEQLSEKLGHDAIEAVSHFLQFLVMVKQMGTDLNVNGVFDRCTDKKTTFDKKKKTMISHLIDGIRKTFENEQESVHCVTVHNVFEEIRHHFNSRNDDYSIL